MGKKRVKIGPIKLLRQSWRAMRRGGIAPVAVAFASIFVQTAIGIPIINWLFRVGMRAGGMQAVDFDALTLNGRSFISVIILFLVGALAFLLAVVQIGLVVLLIEQTAKTGRISAKLLGRSLLGVLEKLPHRSAIPLFAYLFLIMPLSGFGFFSTLTRHIEVPNFISGELLKDPVTGTLWHLLMLVLLWVNLRLALTIPIFMNTAESGWNSMKLSWRSMKILPLLSMVAAALIVVVPAILIASLLILIAIVPTALTDRFAPNTSAPVAAFSAGIAHVVLVLLFSAVITLLLGVLCLLARRAAPGPLRKELAPSVPKRDASPEYNTKPWIVSLSVGGVCIALLFGFAYLGPMRVLETPPDAEVIAHRGYVAGGVENTIPALEAAARVGADRVEMDVMQTKDKRFVVMHDTDLRRLAGINKHVKDLTLDELTEITVHDEHGNTAKIPSLEEYVTRANELGMPLLMEVKMGGLDTDDHVDLLVEELQTIGASEKNIFHSLDRASVSRLKELMPDAEVGYIMPFAGIAVPKTDADFLVLEEYTATLDMQRAARNADLGFVVWTVDNQLAQRARFRQGVDAVITDRPDTALSSLEEMNNQTGLVGALFDVMKDFAKL